MPTYDYQCSACDDRYTVLHKMSEPAPACPSCGSLKVLKLVSAPAVHGKTSSMKSMASESPPAMTGGGCGSSMCGHKH
ncbi:MAG: zinc ribbon domain-containing protein [Methylococcus sp.]|nr:MAG: zinc ribbon domain-containing protein [Methylococcus sp.]